MTKGEYCKQKGIHFSKPKFDVNSEADKEFCDDMDEFCHIMKNKYNIINNAKFRRKRKESLTIKS